MTGTTRKAERLFVAGSLSTPVCSWCGQDATEDHDRFYWKCPAWDDKRSELFQKKATKHVPYHLARVIVLCCQRRSWTWIFSTRQEIQSFIVDVQTRIIQVTHARDAAKAHMTHERSHPQPDDIPDEEHHFSEDVMITIACIPPIRGRTSRPLLGTIFSRPCS